MKSLCWNCRGLGGPRTVHEVARMVKRYNPQILLLSETKRKCCEMESLRVRWGFNFCFSVECEGRRGGLAVLWNSEIRCVVKSFSNNHIDFLIEEEVTWRMTLFYGHPVTHQRNATWELLKRLNDQMELPWICVGDFNEILKKGEASSGL